MKALRSLFSSKQRNLLIVVLLLLVIVVVSIVIMQIPGKKTAAVDDLAIIKDFARIQALTDNYFQTNNRLPASLDALDYAAAGNYDYITTDNTVYKLCAIFSSDSSDSINAQAGINATYKQGYDCVVFGAQPKLSDLKITQRVDDLVLLKATFSQTPKTGIVQGEKGYSIDTTKSHFYKDNTTGNYLANLYLTILGGNECGKSSSANLAKCCYNWTGISAIAANNVELKHNKLGASEYIYPQAKSDTNTFGDLPMSFCLSSSNQIAGGLSLIIPAKAYSKDSVSFTLKINETQTEGVPLKIQISTK